LGATMGSVAAHLKASWNAGTCANAALILQRQWVSDILFFFFFFLFAIFLTDEI
jgi:hypothetical protein